MKTQGIYSRRAGSVLLTTMVITGILGFALASYLTMISTQNRSVWRSQVWNSTIPVAEAGIEEAIVHLNKSCVTNDITSAAVDWNADGWTSVSGGVQMTRWLGENHYVVTIVTNSPFSPFQPGILSEGYVPALLSYAPQTIFAAVGLDQTTTPSLARKIRVTTRQDGFIARGLVARDSIDLKGNGVTTDSFDSEDPAYSTGGQYDPAKNKDHGDVAVNYGLTDSLGLGNANIFGSVAVGPGGSISIGPNGQVGDKTWNASNTGIQPGHSRDDMNVSFPDVQVPFTGGYSVPTGRTVTNLVITGVSTTNTSVSYPSGSGIVLTNTVASTTTTYPVGGTYIGSVITNTSYVTTTGFPSSGTYLGVVVTNSTSVTTSDVPDPGTYLGDVTTNTVRASSGSYPASGTYVGVVTTNTTTTTSGSYPSSYIGNVITNTSLTYSDTYPSSGTYIGTVVVNKTGSGKIKGYYYNRITGYTYQKPSGFSFNKITDYTSEQIASFSYFKITGYTVAKIVSYSLIQSTFTTNYMAKYYDYVLDSGNYKIDSMSGDVLILGDAVLYVTSNLSPNSIQINPTAKLRLYNASPSFDIAGNTFINASGDASRLWYYGLPSNTGIRMHGNAGFIGVIYAPEAALTLGGGGNDTTDTIGAIVAKTAKLNGHFNFHYDEALARKGPSRGFIIDSWDEIKLTDTQ
jgi:hypothetical protein